jgi:hypothetical protein
MHPYKITSAHQLLLIDPLGRVEYSNWFQNNLNDNLFFFTDEAWFHLYSHHLKVVVRVLTLSSLEKDAGKRVWNCSSISLMKTFDFDIFNRM